MKINNIILSLLFTASLSLLAPGISAQKFPFELPKLPYAYNALEPAIDAATMEIHYSKHHAAYVKNLNAALKGTEEEKYSLRELLLYASDFSETVRNNAGGHYNHSLFWNILSPGHPFDPVSGIGKEVIATFSSADTLRKELYKAGLNRFGSGWAWLVVTPERKLTVCSTPNQDNPVMDVSPVRGIPILCIDVWEHAYYLKYQNKRADYLNAIFSVIDWSAVDRNYAAALSDPLLVTLEKETWKELSSFHGVMAGTFHPSEEGNLTPIRERSGEFLEKARALESGRIPSSFDTPAIRQAIHELVSGGFELDRMVHNKATDKDLAAKLEALHEVFHRIQGLCRH
ncbi:MAG TPA: Fe-Mn family superoxide dismutase [Bacteroidales bacterium]|nr:Fe-Mn family superoxide dismutase [Bacteroidales bacterium]